jgi:hypothetical protein
MPPSVTELRKNVTMYLLKIKNKWAESTALSMKYWTKFYR